MVVAGPVRDFKGTEDGEWAVENGDFAVVAGADAVPQGIRCRLGMFLGECYLDEGAGVDYLGSILVKNPDDLVVRALLEEAIANTPDVTSVLGAQLDIDPLTREAAISYTAGTIYSETPLDGQEEIP